jgi:hypothetical protein
VQKTEIQQYKRQLGRRVVQLGSKLKKAKIVFPADITTTNVASVQLHSEGKRIAYAQISIRKNTGKIELFIDSVQGLVEKEDIARFKRNNKGKYLLYELAKAIVASAYEAGCDRVLLKDITSTDELV